MDETTTTVEERLRAQEAALTRAERRVAAHLLDDYPVSGLRSITALAEAAEVSTPTVARLVQKLGFEGFGAFQEALRAEFSARVSGPLEKRARWSAEAPESHILNRFADAVIANLRGTLAQMDPARFDAAADRLADPARRVFVVGGRITAALADYLCTHLQVMRPGVRRLGLAPGSWPHDLLDLEGGDVLVVFDIRRYETVLKRVAEMAAAKGAEVVLFTDQWGSPVGRVARHRLSARVEAPSAWDSTVAILLAVEALLVAVQERGWETSRARMAALDAMFDQTRLFMK